MSTRINYVPGVYGASFLMELSDVTNFIQLMSGFLVSLTALVAALLGIVKPLRKWLMGHFSSGAKIDASLTLLKEAITAVTRNELTEIYDKAVERGFIGDYDRENFLKMYKVYSDLGGNSYVHEIHKQILTMPRKPVVKKGKRK